MTNVDRFNEYLCCGYDYDCTDVVTGGNDTGITKCWIVDDKGKRITHTIMYQVCTDANYETVEFNTLSEAVEAYKEGKY